MTPDRIRDLRAVANDPIFFSHPPSVLTECLDEIERLSKRIETLDSDCVGMLEHGGFQYMDEQRTKSQKEADTMRATAEEMHKKYIQANKRAAEMVRQFANVYYVMELEATANTQMNKLADEIERGEG